MARTFGFIRVDDMLDELTSDELNEWIAEYHLSPWDEERADLRSALAAAGICNSWGAKTAPKDFMPDFSGKPRASGLGLVQQLVAAGLPVKIGKRE